MRNGWVLNLFLVLLCIYFLAMSVAHFIGFKVPLLFIYYDVPSEVYQDKIISFCAFAYAMFAIATLRARAAVVPFILALVGVVVGLSLVNLSESLEDAMKTESTMIYWAQTAVIGVLTGLLAFLHFKKPKS